MTDIVLYSFSDKRALSSNYY